MPKTYQITSQRRMRQLQHVMHAGDAETIIIDLSSWVAANSAITSATWAVKSGDVSLSTPTTASPTTRSTITASSITRARILITATDSTQTVSITLLLRVIEPQDISTYDYGWIE